jgi:hypothetical protein
MGELTKASRRARPGRVPAIVAWTACAVLVAVVHRTAEPQHVSVWLMEAKEKSS